MPKRTAVRLTVTRVREHKATDRRAYLWDTTVDGLGLEAAPNGRRSWVLSYRLLGKAKRVTLGQYPAMDLDAAREEAQALRSALRQGVDPVVERKRQRAAGSVRELGEEYMQGRYFATRSADFRANFASTWRRYIEPALGDMPVEAVRRAHVRAIVDDLVAAGKEGMATGCRTHLAVLFNHAIDIDRIEHSPVDRVRVRRTTSGRRERWLRADEIRAAWHVETAAAMQLMVRWLLLTGCRRDEARLARHDQIEAGVWVVPRTKNTRELALPVMPMMQAVADESARLFPGSPWLFPATTSSTKPLPRGSTHHLLAGVDWSPHVLRHTVATWLQELGVERDARQAVLNHIDAGMAARYGHSRQIDMKRTALATWHDELARQVGIR
jgi:integrase